MSPRKTRETKLGKDGTYMVNMKRLLGRAIPAAAAALAIAVGLAVTPIAANAAGMSASGENSVEFEAGGSNPGTTGGLELDAVPKFNFGMGQVSSSPKTYNSQSGSDADKFIKVRDESGTAQGWNLVGQLSNFTNGSVTLSGLTVAINLGGGGITQRDNSGNTYGNNAKPTLTSQTLTTGGASGKIMTAAQNAGMGTFWADVTATLTVPGGAARKGQFKATITWTLGANP